MPQLLRRSSGSLRMASMPRSSSRRAAVVGVGAPADGARAPPHAAAAATVSATRTGRTATSFGKFVEGLQHFGEFLGLRLGGARFARPAEVDIAAALPECDALFLLVVLELRVD